MTDLFLQISIVYSKPVFHISNSAGMPLVRGYVCGLRLGKCACSQGVDSLKLVSHAGVPSSAPRGSDVVDFVLFFFWSKNSASQHAWLRLGKK